VKACSENLNLVAVRQKYEALYMKPYIDFIVAGKAKLSLSEMVSGS
jgi:hypothetical protein